MNIVKELRKKRGIQQKELAIYVGVAQPTVSEWESGKKDPSGERLRKLAEFFGVDELVVLGAGFAEQTESDAPKTKEAKIISGGVDNMPPEIREKAMVVMETLFSEYFKKGQNNETEP